MRLGACTVTVYDGAKQVAQHERITVRGDQALNLDHYLEVLQRKPGALPGATALAQARASGAFTREHEVFWAEARAQIGDARGTRALVEVLLLHRHLPAADVIAGITAALRVNSVSPDVVAVEARKSVHPDGPTPLGLILPRVVDLQARRAAANVEVPTETPTGAPTEIAVDRPIELPVAIPLDRRPLPSVAPYDDLLKGAGS